MDYLQAILLAIIQGLTEFLPVSSSGHLALAQSFFETALGIKLADPLLFDVAVHVGTLLSILLVFRRPFFTLLRTIRRDLPSVLAEPANFWRKPALRLLLFVIIASVPTGAMGLAFEADFHVGGETLSLSEHMAREPVVVSFMLIATGGILLLPLLRRRQKRGIRDFGAGGAFLLGLAQGVALIPGISRSGTTISAGLLLGLRRRWCVMLSFLILVPATLGALAMKIAKTSLQHFGIHDLLSMLLAVVVSAAVGYFALQLLVSLVVRRKLHWFAWYCWALGGGFLLYKLLA
ncbi:MAG: undecaprenyl-diphosphate phosphatase [Planctomycetia bacterium]|nr:undecaprenyl-diphosphate phosphatase [Planctomycetia bacterium]